MKTSVRPSMSADEPGLPEQTIFALIRNLVVPTSETDKPFLIRVHPCSSVVKNFLFVLAVLVLNSSAFPPAPHHEIYGTIRDQSGEPLQFTAATVTLETTS